MKAKDRRHLLIERDQLKKILSEIPDENVIDKNSVKDRLSEIESILSEIEVPEKEPAIMRLLFKGKPVIDSHGIFADFSANAIEKFIDSIAKVAASYNGPLAPTGPIPNKEQYQLLITNTSLGSFGFELEEYISDQASLLEGPSSLELAIQQTQTLLKDSTGTDEELANTMADFDPRAIDAIRSFLNAVVDGEATFSMEFKEHKIGFNDYKQVKNIYERLKKENIKEEEKILEGMFQGVLPKKRTFEFVLEKDNVISGTISQGINPHTLNEILNKKVSIKLLTRQVSSGPIKYTLLEVMQK